MVDSVEQITSSFFQLHRELCIGHNQLFKGLQVKWDQNLVIMKEILREAKKDLRVLEEVHFPKGQ